MIEKMQQLYRELSKPMEEEKDQNTIRDYLQSSSIIETASVPVIKLVCSI
jgi:hypothetical protein